MVLYNYKYKYINFMHFMHFISEHAQDLQKPFFFIWRQFINSYTSYKRHKQFFVRYFQVLSQVFQKWNSTHVRSAKNTKNQMRFLKEAQGTSILFKVFLNLYRYTCGSLCIHMRKSIIFGWWVFFGVSNCDWTHTSVFLRSSFFPFKLCVFFVFICYT